MNPRGDQAQLALNKAQTFDPPECCDWREGVWACLDLEMTGLGPDDRICEIAIVRMRKGEVIDSWSSLVNPGREIPQEATAVNGITNEMVKDAPRIEDLRADIERRLADPSAIIAYNGLGADFEWLKREVPGTFAWAAFEAVLYDPLVIVRRALRYMRGNGDKRVNCPIFAYDEDGNLGEMDPKKIGRHALMKVAEFLNLLPAGAHANFHRAEFDAKAAGDIGWALRAECNPNGAEFEAWERQEFVRQTNENAAYRAKMRAQDAEKKATRETFESRIVKRLFEIERLLNDHLNGEA